MRQDYYLEAEPFEIYPELDEYDVVDAGLTGKTWTGEVNRKNRKYIRWVQQSLNRVMGLRLPIDGILGPATRSAIRSFQQRQGLAVDGMAGPETKRALMAARRGRARPDEVGLYQGAPKLDDEEWPDLEMETPGPPGHGIPGCIKTYAVPGYKYTQHKLSLAQKGLIAAIAGDILTLAPSLAGLRKIRIVGFASGTRRLKFHAEERAFFVALELETQLIDLVGPGKYVHKLSLGDPPVTKLVSSRAASDPAFRKVEICIQVPPRKYV